MNIKRPATISSTSLSQLAVRFNAPVYQLGAFYFYFYYGNVNADCDAPMGMGLT